MGWLHKRLYLHCVPSQERFCDEVTIGARQSFVGPCGGAGARHTACPSQHDSCRCSIREGAKREKVYVRVLESVWIGNIYARRRTGDIGLAFDSLSSRHYSSLLG